MTTKAYKRREKEKFWGYIGRGQRRRCDWPACQLPCEEGHKFCRNHVTVERFEANVREAIHFTSQVVTEWDDARWTEFARHRLGHEWERTSEADKRRYVLAARSVGLEEWRRIQENREI